MNSNQTSGVHFSTDTSLIDVSEYNNIINGFDSWELVGVVMLDLKKAFDTVDSEISAWIDFTDVRF